MSAEITNTTPYTSETMELLFPEPIDERFYLWAHHYEDVVPGQWSHPGVLPEDDPEFLSETGCYTTARAIFRAREMDALMLRVAHIRENTKGTLWDMAAYYQWLCVHGTGPDGEGISVSSDDVEAWAEGSLPK